MFLPFTPSPLPSLCVPNYSSQVYWLTFCTAIVGCIPSSDFKRRLIRLTLNHCFDFLSNAISAVVYYHNPENRPVNGICVANHTSPIDALVLMCDNCYSLVSDLALLQPHQELFLLFINYFLLLSLSLCHVNLLFIATNP
jgi:hypothetical protein